MTRALALLLALLASALPALAQEAPRVSVATDPAGPVTVGAPVRVALTVLVPSYMPQPPEWPDLQIADAITRLPGRATTPVTRQVGGESWSGLTRTYEIVPQRAADYDLSGATVTLTWAGDDATPRTATLAVPDIAFSATVPAGAERLDPFLAAEALSLSATSEGLPEAPKPGDAVTLTLTTTASGPPAMLLPPLFDRIATPPGLRAYPKAPVLTDRPGERGGPPTATRQEGVTYVIEAPGHYALPGISLDWWNVARGAVETATIDPVTFDVAGPPARTAAGAPPRRALLATLLAGGLIAAALLLRRRHASRPPPPPTARRLYRTLRRSVRTAPAGSLRREVLAWLRAAAPAAAHPSPDVDAALLAVERTAYGPTGRETDAGPARDNLLAALARQRRALSHGGREGPALASLPPLNPQADSPAHLLGPIPVGPAG